jgi:hypothetical protein
MLHNSLHRRDLLKAMNANPLCVRRRDVHRHVGRREGVGPQPNQIALDGTWKIEASRNASAERAVAADAEDFLKRMGVTIDGGATSRVHLEIGSRERGFRTVVEPGRVEVHAADASCLWSGWTQLEYQMRMANGPLLVKGEHQAEPMWEVQIAPPAWGANMFVPDFSSEYLGDDAFRSLAHAGANGMFVYGDFLCYAATTRLPEIDQPDAAQHIETLRDAARRAANFGIKLYLVAVSPKLPADHAVFKAHPGARGAQLAAGGDTPDIHCLCSSDADALGFHADVMGHLFKEIPDLGGLVLIIGGESYYHCFMRAAGAGKGRTNCKQCDGKLAEDVIANLLKVTADAVQQHQPAAKIMAWPYSAQGFWSAEPHQLKFIDRLPANVALCSEIDKDQHYVKDGYTKSIWDYSVDFTGPSDRIIAQANRCAQRERELFIKTETAHGIELLHLPYVPCIQRSARRWQAIRSIRPTGLIQRWGFIGMYDSVAESIGFVARWDPDFTPEGSSLAIAMLYFADAAPRVTQAWKQFDRAVGHIPLLVTGGYYLGPLFLGPCHPLPTWTGPTPDAFRGSLYYLLEAEATFAKPRAATRDDLTVLSLGHLQYAPYVEREFTAAMTEAAAGHEILKKIDPQSLPPHCREALIEQQAIGEYLYRTFVSTVNLIRFLKAKEAGGDNRAKLVEAAKDELENTKSARTIYERAPYLSHHLRLDMGAHESIRMIDAKVELLEKYLATT